MIVAYTALHYGSPYLAAAIRSVIDYVEQYYVLYSPDGSHGRKANGARLPESDQRENLQWIAHDAAKKKLVWVDGNWQHEGQQRDSIYRYAPDADIILVLDYDEIWHPDTVRQALSWVEATNQQFYRVAMIHYWRAFHRCVLHDPAFPIRFIQPGKQGETTLNVTIPINHLGYAIPSWLMRYKWTIHGHQNEFRRDVDWFADKWEANAQQDCHPVGSDFWNPEEVNPTDYLPGWMVQHKYFGMEVIE